MKKIIILISLVFMISPARAETASKKGITILFVGNSYTYANDLPGILMTIIDSTRCDTVPIPEVRIMSIAKGGYSLEQHWQESREQIEDSLKKASSGRNEIVLVLQEHSMGALTPAGRDKLSEFAGLLSYLGRKYEARVVLFQTWGRRVSFTRYGTPRRTIDQYMYQDVIFGDTTVLDESITSASKGICRTYRRLAVILDTELAPCGEAFAEAIRQGIFVHRLDEAYGSHPNPIGSYLAACVIFGTVFDVPPEYIPEDVYRYIWPALARRLHAIAEEAVNGRLDP
jgi:hypothetical protein